MAIKVNDLILKELKASLSGLDRCILVTYTRMNGGTVGTMRRELREQGVKLQMVKNSIAALAFTEIGVAEIDQFLNTGTSAVVYGADDIVSLSKAVQEQVKKHKDFQTKGGMADGRVLSAADVATMAALPSREQLLAQFTYGIASPISQFAGVLRALLTGPIYALKAIQEKGDSS